MRGLQYSSQISKYILRYIYICVMNYMKVIFGLFLKMSVCQINHDFRDLKKLFDI